jgi:hypothetical protein
MNKEDLPLAALVAISAFLGFGSLLVSFAAASAFETPGTTSNLEVCAMCVATALYLAFCQFWVAPRGRGRFWARLLTVVALIAPSLANPIPAAHGILWLTSVSLGSVVGALIAHWLTARPQRQTPTAGSINRGRSSRNYLRAGFILLLAAAAMTTIGVIPLILVATPPVYNTGPITVFLGITVAFALLAATLLGFPLRRSRDQAHFSRGPLGITASLALFLAAGYALVTQMGGDGLAVRTACVLLILCAAFAVITSALMAITSVIEDRAWLS